MLNKICLRHRTRHVNLILVAEDGGHWLVLVNMVRTCLFHGGWSVCSCAKRRYSSVLRFGYPDSLCLNVWLYILVGCASSVTKSMSHSDKMLENSVSSSARPSILRRCRQ